LGNPLALLARLQNSNIWILEINILESLCC
jgi:hypothetical protein